jgi:hypothetical protein
MESVHFTCHQELWGKEKKTKEELSKLHSELQQNGESQKYYVSMSLILMEFKTDTPTDIQIGLCLLLSDTVIISSSNKRDCHINITNNTHVCVMNNSRRLTSHESHSSANQI